MADGWLRYSNTKEQRSPVKRVMQVKNMSRHPSASFSRVDLTRRLHADRSSFGLTTISTYAIDRELRYLQSDRQLTALLTDHNARGKEMRMKSGGGEEERKRND